MLSRGDMIHAIEPEIRDVMDGYRDAIGGWHGPRVPTCARRPTFRSASGFRNSRSPVVVLDIPYLSNHSLEFSPNRLVIDPVEITLAILRNANRNKEPSLTYRADPRRSGFYCACIDKPGDAAP